VHIFGFSLATLDIAGEHPPHKRALDRLSRYLQLPGGATAHGRDQRSPGCCGTPDPPAAAAASRQLEAGHRRDLRGFSHAGSGCNGNSAANLAAVLRDLDVPYGLDLLEVCCWRKTGLVDPKTVKHPVVGGAPVSKRWKICRRAPAVMDRAVSPSPSTAKLLASSGEGRQAPCRKVCWAYSTSNKISGFLSSKLDIPKPRSPCSAFSCQYDVALRFHGRRWIRWAWRWAPPYQAIPGQPSRTMERPHQDHRAGRGAGVRSIPCQSLALYNLETMTTACAPKNAW